MPQDFLSAHSFIYGHFRPRRHQQAACAYRKTRSDAFNVWHEENLHPGRGIIAAAQQPTPANRPRQVNVTMPYRRFHAIKTYGKEPESLDSIIEGFDCDLAGYPAEKSLLAIKTHSQRSQEFPTTADIIGLIRRNGRPPLTEAQFVAINRKVSRSAVRRRVARHLNIGEQHMNTAGVDLENIQSRFGVFGMHNFEAFIIKRLDDDQADQFFIFGHEN